MSSNATTLPAAGTLGGGPAAALGERRDARVSPALAAAGAGLLLAIVGGCALIVLVAANRPTFLVPASHIGYLPRWLAGPLGGLLPSFTHDRDTIKYLFTFCLLGMYACYVLALRYVPRLPASWAIGAVVVAYTIMFLSPPLSLNDTFNYLNYGRMEVVHHLNPYTTIPALEPHRDATFALSNWHGLLSPYGPLFTIATMALVPLGVAASFWTLKALLLAAALGTLLLVWRCALMLGRDPVAALVFVGLNPLVLIWGMGGDHNDFIMVFLVVLAVYSLLGGLERDTRRGDIVAGAALAAAIAVKASAAILIPVVLVGLARAPRRVLRVVLGLAGAGVVLAIASVIAFGAHLPDLATQARLVTSLGLPNVVGYLLGGGGETTTLHLLLTGVLAVATVAACVYAWRRGDWLTAAGWATFALVATLSWTLPWYVLWLLPLAALGRSRRLRGATLMLGLYMMLSWVPPTPDFNSAIGFSPNSTALGQMRQYTIQRLYR